MGIKRSERSSELKKRRQRSAKVAKLRFRISRAKGEEKAKLIAKLHRVSPEAPVELTSSQKKRWDILPLFYADLPPGASNVRGRAGFAATGISEIDMAKDWEKLAGEKGERVKSGKLERMMRLGGVGAGVAASSIAGKFRNMIGGGDEALKDNHRKNAQRMVGVLGQLKGASMKVGQILSADPELLPPEFAEGLAQLQKDAPPMTWNTVKAQIESALDRPIEDVFDTFDPDPVGAASIGQVHRARLRTGEDVAVKIQYPGVSDALESDLDALKSMLALGRTFVERERMDNYFKEIRDVLMDEADYTKEAGNLERFSEYLKAKPNFRVPKPFREWTRPTVLVMEFIEGTKLDEALAAMEPDERNVWLERWIDIYVWMFHELMELHADPHPGNFLIDANNKLVMLDFGCVRSFPAPFADGILEVLDTVWQNEPERALKIYKDIGFGGDAYDPDAFDPEVVANYHDIVLAPFLRDEPFEFAKWQPTLESNAFVMRNPAFMVLTPPPDALMYFRVLSGIKGLLSKFDARINIYELAVETARRRGVLTE
ncbi:MAG: DUF6800 family protein [bacterium]